MKFKCFPNVTPPPRLDRDGNPIQEKTIREGVGWRIMATNWYVAFAWHPVHIQDSEECVWLEKVWKRQTEEQTYGPTHYIVNSHQTIYRIYEAPAAPEPPEAPQKGRTL